MFKFTNICQSYKTVLKCNCVQVIIVKNPNDAPSAKNVKYSEVSFDEFPGKKLILETGDITTMKVDAIVNAADPKLQHRGGIARAIVDRGK